MFKSFKEELIGLLIYCEVSYKLRGVQFLSFAHHSS